MRPNMLKAIPRPPPGCPIPGRFLHLTINGGSSRMTLPWVQLTKSPRSRQASTTGAPSWDSSRPHMRPRPRTSLITANLAWSCARLLQIFAFSPDPRQKFFVAQESHGGLGRGGDDRPGPEGAGVGAGDEGLRPPLRWPAAPPWAGRWPGPWPGS